jgi:hypothetical protein
MEPCITLGAWIDYMNMDLQLIDGCEDEPLRSWIYYKLPGCIYCFVGQQDLKALNTHHSITLAEHSIPEAQVTM